MGSQSHPPATPPRGGDRYDAQPVVVTAEQYFAATDPPLASVCTCDLVPQNPPHVHGVVGVHVLTDTDWIVYREDGTVGTCTAALFQYRYKPHPPGQP